MTEYLPRIVARELELRLQASGATLIVGPKWCGKTTTGEQKAKEQTKPEAMDYDRCVAVVWSFCRNVCIDEFVRRFGGASGGAVLLPL